jgi:hypothetical protein
MRRRYEGGTGRVINHLKGRRRGGFEPPGGGGRPSWNVRLENGNNSRISGHEGVNVSSGLRLAAVEVGGNE